MFPKKGKGRETKQAKEEEHPGPFSLFLFSSNALITAAASSYVEGRSHEDEDCLIPILRRREIFAYLFPRNSTGTFSFARC